jgi:hypothetical protein
MPSALIRTHEPVSLGYQQQHDVALVPGAGFHCVVGLNRAWRIRRLSCEGVATSRVDHHPPDQSRQPSPGERTGNGSGREVVNGVTSRVDYNLIAASIGKTFKIDGEHSTLLEYVCCGYAGNRVYWTERIAGKNGKHRPI